MRIKGNVKRVGNKPNFWGKYEKNVPLEVKYMIYKQYYSYETLYIYCDASLNRDQREMSSACTLIQNGSVTVKHQLVFPPQDCINKNVFGELKAIVFALNLYKKFINKSCKNVIIFTDQKDIYKYLRQKKFFRNVSLQKLQIELILLFNEQQMLNPNISISLTYLEQGKYNPFAKSAHNAARKVLNK